MVSRGAMSATILPPRIRLIGLRLIQAKLATYWYVMIANKTTGELRTAIVNHTQLHHAISAL